MFFINVDRAVLSGPVLSGTHAAACSPGARIAPAHVLAVPPPAVCLRLGAEERCLGRSGQVGTLLRRAACTHGSPLLSPCPD